MARYSRLFSAYLDGQATPAERQKVEKLIQRDPQACQTLEAMRKLHALISASAPSRVSVPPDFRSNIMQRLHHPDSGPDASGPRGGGSPWIGSKLFHYILAGVVLTGLSLSFILRDRQEASQRHTASEDKSIEINDQQNNHQLQDQPLAPGPKTQSPGVTRDWIQSLPATVDFPADSSSAPEPSGSVYVRGQGIRKQILPQPAPVDIPATSTNETMELSQPPAESLSLESATRWSPESIKNYCARQAIILSEPADIVFSLAQQLNLNPGLLIAANHILPEKDLFALAHKMRASLDASAGQAAEQRLLRVIQDLGGNASALIQWKKIILQQP